MKNVHLNLLPVSGNWEAWGSLILPYFTGSLKNYFTPYIFGGAALLYHRPQIGNLDLRDYRTENTYYSYYAFSIPFGMGVKYSFSKRIATTLEWGMRKTFTDYIDDISTTYYIDRIKLDELSDEELESLRFSDPTEIMNPECKEETQKQMTGIRLPD